MTQLEQTQSVVLDSPAASGTNPLVRTVLRVAWLSICLGLALEVVLLVLAAFTGTAGDTPKPFISDLAQKVSWSFIVCVGLAFGSTAGKAREGIMGALGLISAPAGFTAARAMHKAVNGALGVAGKAMAPGLVLLVGGLKGVQYALFGAVLGWITKRAFGLKTHVAAGLAFGLTFGLAIVATTVRAAATPVPPVDIAARVINEVLFPVGCSLVLYASGMLAKKLPR
ncbi:MAG TPA: hypothetical protein VNM67_05965 [Thermoanaerobaculia bacterium]|jgi:hypothetical protein|nr:hypothetical protein [Thermoanaerobaculia bacterium]